MFGGYVDLTVLPAYLPIAVLICAVPGPDMAFMVATGLALGRRAAWRAALGASLGVTIYTVVVAAGLGPLVAAYPPVLIGLQIFGALYLARLAFLTLRSGWRSVQPSADHRVASGAAFRRGLISTLSNPKMVLFFAALLPQFIGSAQAPFLQLLLLGLVFQFFGLIFDGAAGWASAAVRVKVLGRPAAIKAIAYVSGSVLAVLAVLVGTDAVRELTQRSS